MSMSGVTVTSIVKASAALIAGTRPCGRSSASNQPVPTRSAPYASMRARSCATNENSRGWPLSTSLTGTRVRSSPHAKTSPSPGPGQTTASTGTSVGGIA